MDDDATTVSPTKKMTMIDWFRKWPPGALRSVALDVCLGVDLGKKEYPLLLNDVVNFSFLHECVEKISGSLLDELRRCTSPEKYSEMLGTFIKLLEEKRMEIAMNPRKFEMMAQLRLPDRCYSKLVGSEDLNSGGAPVQPKKLDLNFGKPGTYELPKRWKMLSTLCSMMNPSQKVTGKSCLPFCGNQEAKGTETTIDEFEENTREWTDDLLETFSTSKKLVKEMPPQKNLLVGVGTTGLDALREGCERKDLHPIFDEVDQVMVAEKVLAQKEEELTGARAMVDVAQEDLKRAVDALNCVHLPKLSRKDLVELKSLSNPPKSVKRTMEAVCLLLGINMKTKGKKPADNWSVARKLLSDPSKLLDRLRALDGDNIKEGTIQRVAVYLQSENFTVESVRRASRACTGIYEWVRAIYSHHQAALQVPLKHAALNAAEEKVANTRIEVTRAQAMMEDLQVFIQLEAKVQKEVELAKQPMSASHVENSMMSEVVDIAIASQSTVSRCGLVHEPTFLGMDPLMTFRLEGQLDFDLPKVVVLMEGMKKVQGFFIENGMIVPKARQCPLMIDHGGQTTEWIGTSNSASDTNQVIEDHGNMNPCNPDLKFAMTTKLRNPQYPKAIVKENCTAPTFHSSNPVVDGVVDVATVVEPNEEPSKSLFNPDARQLSSTPTFHVCTSSNSGILPTPSPKNGPNSSTQSIGRPLESQQIWVVKSDPFGTRRAQKKPPSRLRNQIVDEEKNPVEKNDVTLHKDEWTDRDYVGEYCDLDSKIFEDEFIFQENVHRATVIRCFYFALEEYLSQKGHL
ncbi:hypothetical protein BSKO_05789 [Bryopsis sp. KO-2023]|nr:hypothetical protein BSKO_05789 [Bryopsis sp. KO-2023]